MLGELAGFVYRQICPTEDLRRPIVLLHGSGGSELSLTPLAAAIASDRTAFALRGRVPWEGGWAFFSRNPDRTINHDDLNIRANEVCAFLEGLASCGHHMPYLVGYSNGAIMAAAVALQAPELSSGALLLRPLSPCASNDFPPMHGYPTLLLEAEFDDRRTPDDAPRLARQLEVAGAQVMLHVLPIGHALTPLDAELSRSWVADRP